MTEAYGVRVALPRNCLHGTYAEAIARELDRGAQLQFALVA